MFEIFALAFGIGVAMSIPVGAYTIAAAKRAITQGFQNALIFTCGSLAADAIYALLAYFGVAPFLDGSMVIRLTLWGIGGAWLCWLGWDAVTTRITHQTVTGLMDNESLKQSFIAGFGLTVFNPLAIAGWIALAGGYFSRWDSNLLPLFPFGLLAIIIMLAGTMTYCTGYIALLSHIRRFINPRILTFASFAAGLFLIFFGLSAWWSAGQMVLAAVSL